MDTLTTPPATPHDNLRTRVAEDYARAVNRPAARCCGSPVPKGVVAQFADYRADDLASLPPEAVVNAFGCGNPLAFAEVQPGDVVLDLGAGAGIDLLLAAKQVGPTGTVIGVDMTDAMIAKARENIAAAGLNHIEVRQGMIEALPVDTASVDWVISNCVINLSPEKQKVFAEIARVLKPGGRMLVSDIVAEDLPAEMTGHRRLYSSCLAGAISEKAYLEGLRQAGLVDVNVRDRLVYDTAQLEAFIGAELQAAETTGGGTGDAFATHWATRPQGQVASVKVSARKPREPSLTTVWPPDNRRLDRSQSRVASLAEHHDADVTRRAVALEPRSGSAILKVSRCAYRALAPQPAVFWSEALGATRSLAHGPPASPDERAAWRETMLDCVIEPHRRDLGGFEVGRVLPSARRRMIGPFIFFDHLGPIVFPPGIPRSVDVRPHPHIGLSTLTYLFAGEIMHRDSVGSEQAILPGEVNWMTAGRGITHSERFERARLEGGPLHGLQTWVALPEAHEETEPTFTHYPAAALPLWQDEGLQARLIAGEALGTRSPVRTHSPLFYVHVQLTAGARVPVPTGYPERAAYIVAGAVQVDGHAFIQGRLLLFQPGQPADLTAATPATIMLLGGEPVGDRFIEWNFVSSSRERIAQAKADWRAGRMKLPDRDNQEFIPLPDDPPPPANALS